MTNRPGCWGRRIPCQSTGLAGAKERQCGHARPPRACPGSGADLRRNTRGERRDQQAAKEEVGTACREGHQPQELKEDRPEAAGATKLALLVAHLSAPGGRPSPNSVRQRAGSPIGSRRTRRCAAAQGPRHPVREGRGLAPLPHRGTGDMTGEPGLRRDRGAHAPWSRRLREVWRDRYGAPPKLRSAELLRHCLACGCRQRLSAVSIVTHGASSSAAAAPGRRSRARDRDNAAARMARADSPGLSRENTGFATGDNSSRASPRPRPRSRARVGNGPRFFGLRSAK